jgi:hypothetical protein
MVDVAGLCRCACAAYAVYRLCECLCHRRTETVGRPVTIVFNGPLVKIDLSNNFEVKCSGVYRTQGPTVGSQFFNFQSIGTIVATQNFDPSLSRE